VTPKRKGLGSQYGCYISALAPDRFPPNSILS
jgi:hypothetical protein